MTLISKLGYKPIKRSNLKSPPIKSAIDITVIIPVKDNQSGIDLFLQTFFTVTSEKNYPFEIIIVDNNSEVPVIIKESYPIDVRITKCVKPGPAAARNLGASLAQSDWLLFTDSDCIPTAELITGFLTAQNDSVGYAGNVKALNGGVFSSYYESQEILLPPETSESRPDYLITANCLVWKPAFDMVDGFNESIAIAGGEDIDLGFKLRTVGELSYAFESLALHNFEEDLRSFRKRFRRYGKGNKLVSDIYYLDLTPQLFKPNKFTLVNFYLALLQFLSLRKGYRSKG